MSAESIPETELAALAAQLPASPRLLAELAPRLQQIEVPLADVTALLRRDAGLTARLIAVANSAAYARAEPATSLEDAVASIGYTEIYRVVGALAARQLADEPLALYGIATHRFRENALFVALVMEELAGVTGAEPRAAYTIGLLRSVGKVALDRHGRIAPGPQPLAEDAALLDWERVNWGTSNAQIGARILERWRFPGETVASVREHYAPGADALATSHLLNLAAGAADLRGFGLPAEQSYWQFTPENFARSGVDEGRLVWAGERAFRTLQRISDALG